MSQIDRYSDAFGIPEELERMCSLTPHSREEYVQACGDLPEDDVERARRVWVRLTQGRSHSMKATGWKFVRDATKRMPQGQFVARRLSQGVLDFGEGRL